MTQCLHQVQARGQFTNMPMSLYISNFFVHIVFNLQVRWWLLLLSLLLSFFLFLSLAVSMQYGHGLHTSFIPKAMRRQARATAPHMPHMGRPQGAPHCTLHMHCCSASALSKLKTGSAPLSCCRHFPRCPSIFESRASAASVIPLVMGSPET